MMQLYNRRRDDVIEHIDCEINEEKNFMKLMDSTFKKRIQMKFKTLNYI